MRTRTRLIHIGRGAELSDRAPSFGQSFEVERDLHVFRNVDISACCGIRSRASNEDVPVICRKPLQLSDPTTGKQKLILKDGACYVRSRVGKPASVPVSNETDLRDLLDLAVEKGTRQFVARASKVGLLGVSLEESNATRKFNAELDGIG